MGTLATNELKQQKVKKIMREKHTAIYTETCCMKVTQETQRDTELIFYW